MKMSLYSQNVKVVALMCNLHKLLIGELEEFLKEESFSYTKRRLRGTEVKQSRHLDGLQTKSSLRLDFPLEVLFIYKGVIAKLRIGCKGKLRGNSGVTRYASKKGLLKVECGNHQKVIYKRSCGPSRANDPGTGPIKGDMASCSLGMSSPTGRSSSGISSSWGERLLLVSDRSRDDAWLEEWCLAPLSWLIAEWTRRSAAGTWHHCMVRYSGCKGSLWSATFLPLVKPWWGSLASGDHDWVKGILGSEGERHDSLRRDWFLLMASIGEVG